MEKEEQDYDFVVVEITSARHTPSTKTAIMDSSLLSLSLSFLCVRHKENGERGEELNPTTAKNLAFFAYSFFWSRV
jgi:hypothetical protein